MKTTHIRAPAALALVLTAAAPAALAMPADDLQVKTIADLNGWEIRQFKINGVVESCDAIMITGSEQALRFEHNPQVTAIGFMGLGSAATPDPIPVAMTFGGSNADPVSSDLPIATDLEGTEWRSYIASNEEPDGMLDVFANAQSISFTYATAEGQHTETFTLKGANAATKKVYECVQGK